MKRITIVVAGFEELEAPDDDADAVDSLTELSLIHI